MAFLLLSDFSSLSAILQHVQSTARAIRKPFKTNGCPFYEATIPSQILEVRKNPR
jgi:hypothetical protein